MHFTAALLSILPFVSGVAADCKSFNPDTRPSGDTSYTKTASQTYRISALVNCTAGGSNNVPNSELNLRCNATQCALASESNFLVRVNRTLNVTTSSDAANSLFQVARSSFSSALKVNLNQSWVYSSSGIGTCLNQGDAGYWAFTPTYVCTQGVFSDCSGDGYPSSGTAVELCAVKMLSDGRVPHADGYINVVRTFGIAPEPAPTNATLTPEQSRTGSGGSGSGSSATPSNSAGLLIMSSSAILFGLMAGLLV